MLPLRSVGQEKPSTTPGKELKEMTSGCCVCAEENGWAGNPLVYCDGPGCEVAVHQGCYGIVEVPEGEWFCARCAAISQNSLEKVKIRCELCPSRQGALKRTADGTWTHVTCALYIPEVQFGNVDTMDPIIISNVPSERFNKPCYLCEDYGSVEKAKMGACMPCNRTGCRRVFHVTCGQQYGLLCELGSSPSTVNVKYCGYCTSHIKKASQDPAVKIIGSSSQDLAFRKDSEQVDVKPVVAVIDSKDDIETVSIKSAVSVKRQRVNNNDSSATDVKAKKPRHSSKSSSNASRSVKALLKLVGPVVSDTVTDFQRERVAAQNAAAQNAAAHSQQLLADAQALAVTTSSANTSLSNSSLLGEASTSGPAQSNGYGHPLGEMEKPIAAINGSMLLDVKPPPMCDMTTVSKIAKAEIDRLHLIHQTPSTSGSQQCQFPSTMEELLERQWAQGAQFIKGQAQSDVAQLMTCLNNLKMENMRLQDQMDELQKRRDHLLALNSKLNQSLSCAITQATSPRNSPRIASAAPVSTPSATSVVCVTPVSSSAAPLSTAPSSTPTMCTPSSGVPIVSTPLPSSEDSLNKLRSLVGNDVSPQSRPVVSTPLNSVKHLPVSNSNPTSSGRTSVMSSPPAPTIPPMNGLTPSNVPLKSTMDSGSPVNGQSFQSLLNSSAGFLVPRLPSAPATVPSGTSMPSNTTFPGSQDALLNQLMLQQQQQVLYHVLQQQQRSLDPARIARLFSSPNPVAGGTPGVVSGLGSGLVAAQTSNTTGTSSSSSSSLVK
uniref:Protein AF-10 n=1 Tax=Steinernema glaseri TaxID=37863 RepID=A0A1I7Z0G9_9BILA